LPDTVAGINAGPSDGRPQELLLVVLLISLLAAAVAASVHVGNGRHRRTAAAYGAYGRQGMHAGTVTMDSVWSTSTGPRSKLR
jgi:hypothetical protein